MKFFNKRAATAFMLAVSMMATCVAPVFAEGSKDLIRVPEGTNGTELATNPPMRPYLEWRDRTQFGMPSENVVYVYAKEGETVFFGSSVTEANDRSIEAVVQKETDFKAELEGKFGTLTGSSIAVTLPTEADRTKAFNPSGQVNAEIFVDGSTLSTSKDRGKVYLFNPTANGAGHISNLEMEQNGPNGVDGTTDGYIPLSFVAPYTGTYSFRFLSERYSFEDQPVTPTMDPNARETISIDFQGYGQFGVDDVLKPGNITSKQSYYEPGLGYVSVNSGDASPRIGEVTEKIADATNNYVYDTGDVYFEFTRATGDRGEIRFTPLHNNVELEIVWKATDENNVRRQIYVQQDNRGTWNNPVVKVTPDGTKLNITKISAIDGQPIVAGTEVIVYMLPDTTSTWETTQIYEIRYNYNRTEAQSKPVDPAPTSTPVPAPIKYEQHLDFTELVGMAYGEDRKVTVSSDIYDVKFHGDGVDKGFKYSVLDVPVQPVTGGSSYNCYLEANVGQQGIVGNEDGTTVTDTAASVIEITPKYNNSYVEIIFKGDGSVRQRIGVNGNQRNKDTTTCDDTAYRKVTTDRLSAGTPVYIFFQYPWVQIYDVILHYEDEWEFGDVATPVPMSQRESVSFDGLETDVELTGEGIKLASGGAMGDVLLNPSTDYDGDKVVELAQPVEVNGRNYTRELHLASQYSGGNIIFYPQHAGSWIEIVWRGGKENTKLYYMIGEFSEGGPDVLINTATDTSTIHIDKVPNLEKGRRVKLFIGERENNSIGCIYDIIYHYPVSSDASNGTEVARLNESFSMMSFVETVDNAVSVDFGKISGNKIATYPENDYFDLNVESGYTITTETIKMAKTDDNDNPGQHIKIIPHHEKAWIEMTWCRADNYRAALYSKLQDDTKGFHEGNCENDEIQTTIIDNLAKDKETYIYFGSYGTSASGNIYSITYHYPSYETHALPVSESYTWDLYYLRGANDENGTISQYTSEAILGEGGYSYGASNVDSDYSYDHDIKVYASKDNAAIIYGGALALLKQSEFDGYGNPIAGVLEMIPSYTGTVEVIFDRGNMVVSQPNNNGAKESTRSIDGALTSVSLDVIGGEPVYIYVEGDNCAAQIRAIHYNVNTDGMHHLSRKIDEPWAENVGSIVAAWDVTVASNSSGVYTAQSGRVWTDIFFLNAGNYKASIYPQLNILTKDGFLYDFRMNGVQPYGFVFYSNNRGFLFDRWKLYSEPSWSGQKTPSLERLQALEHSFYSRPAVGEADVGDAPIHIERDGNNNPIIYNGNIMESTIEGNYIPVDEGRDSTHKMFLNEPTDPDMMTAYTGASTLKTISTQEDDYANLLSKVKYIGLGNAQDNPTDEERNKGKVAYGTIGIGGRFEITIDEEEAKRLNTLGASSINITLNFSGYELDEDAKPIANIPVLDDKNEWQKKAEGAEASKAEQNNIVSLSTVIDTAATGIKTYTISWDGRDAYGNVVPKGVYSEGVKSFIEMGMAHFPILDAEHNPNGFKVTMKNDGNSKDTYLYYNNEAVSPKFNEKDPSAWYFTAKHKPEPENYPAQIGDGQNYTSGFNTATKGAMIFGEYDIDLEGGDAARQKVYDALTSGKKQNGGDGGYGNYAAIDMWSKYERVANETITIGVNPIEDLKPYVSFVATNGTVSENAEEPFLRSHVGYSGQVVAEYDGENVTDKQGNSYSTGEGLENIYGNTISTGFVTTLHSATQLTNNSVTWEITVPAEAEIEIAVADTGSDLATTKKIKAPSYIKVANDSFTTQEDVDEAEYIAYELYSGLFADYAIADEEINVGDEYVPDWEADTSLNEDEELDIVDGPRGGEVAELSLAEELYIEEMSVLSEVGDYTNGNQWGITMNLEEEPTLSDTNSKVNRGNIHKINSITGGQEEGSAVIKLAYKLPVNITGEGGVVLGLVIDNLYAPGAIARASFKDDNSLGAYHNITSLIAAGGTAVQSESHEGYVTSGNNEYTNGSSSDGSGSTDKPEEDDDTATVVDGIVGIKAIGAMEWNFSNYSDVSKGKTTFVVDDKTIKVYAGSKDVALEKTEKGTYGGKEYTGCVYLGGTGKADGEASNAAIVFVPEVAGTVEVIFGNGSAARTLIINQDGLPKGSETAEENQIEKAEATEIAAGKAVYIYSENSGLRVYSIKFTPTAN